MSGIVSKGFLLLLQLILILAGGATSVAVAQERYTLTIYVEEARPNGHVFLGLSDGRNEEKWGWYTRGANVFTKLPGLIGCSGGELRRDDATPYTVSLPLQINRDAYYVLKSRALGQQAAGDFRQAKWSPINHCGDFVVDMTLTAGYKLNLPWHVTGYDRPGLFAQFLRANGGTEHDPGVPAMTQDLTPPPVTPVTVPCTRNISAERLQILRNENLRLYQQLSTNPQLDPDGRRRQEAAGLYHCYDNQLNGQPR